MQQSMSEGQAWAGSQQGVPLLQAHLPKGRPQSSMRFRVECMHRSSRALLLWHRGRAARGRQQRPPCDLPCALHHLCWRP